MMLGKTFDLMRKNIQSSCDHGYERRVKFLTLILLAIGVLVSLLFAGNEMLRKVGAEYW